MTSSTVTAGTSANSFCSSGRGAHDLGRVLVTSQHRRPVDVAHERRDIGGRVGPEIDLIGVLVHVEREDRDRAGDGLVVIGASVIDEAAVARDVAEQHPAGTAGKTAGERDELAAPAVDRSEVADERARHRLRDGSAVAAEAREIELVQQRRIQRRELVALQTADRIGGRRRRVERLELLGDRVQADERRRRSCSRNGSRSGAATCR